VVFVLPACAELEPARNYIAAIVNETIITRGQVEAYARPAIEPLLQIYDKPEVLREKVDQVLSEGLEHLIENQLILDDFKSGGAKVPDAMIEDEIKDRIRNQWHDRATLTRELNALGRTYDDYRQQVRDEMILNFMRHKNVASAVLISPQKIEQYYQTNLHQFKLDNQIKLRMIVLNCSAGASIDDVKTLAHEISRKLDEGASFSEMATIYSEGSQSKEGGDFGWREESKLSKGFTDIATGLKPGQHSAVFGFARENDTYWIYQYNKTGQLVRGRKYTDKNDLLEEKKFDQAIDESKLPAPPQEFRLMLVEDKRVAHTERLADVREKIEKDLLVQERERLRKKWVDRLKAKAFVRFY
jgi:peptidyl-prolyl cis-trans isomerase SurA